MTDGDGGDGAHRSLPAALLHAIRSFGPEQRMAAGAATLLFVTMFLPWYQQNVVVSGATSGALQSQQLNAFAVFSFVEAAILLVALAVLAMLLARADGRTFHLPGGDGLIVTIAGGWAALLLLWRLFDKPDLQGSGVGNMGIEWGIFFALAAAGLLASSGVRLRAAERLAQPRPARRPRRPMPPGTAVTRPLPPRGDAQTAPGGAGRDGPTTVAVPTAPSAAPPPPPPPPPPPARRSGTRPTERLDRPPAADRPPTEHLDRRPAAEDPPTKRLPARRHEPQHERLWDDR